MYTHIARLDDRTTGRVGVEASGREGFGRWRRGQNYGLSMYRICIYIYIYIYMYM